MLEDKILLWKIKRGDKEALSAVYMKYKDDLLTVGASLLTDVGAAEDVLHDVFVTFAKGIKGFALYGSLRNYLITCMVNRVRDRFRKKMFEVSGLDSMGPLYSQDDGPEKTVMDSETAERLREMLGHLPMSQREAVVLRVQGGLRFRQIGILQGISENTARSRYQYGMEKLRSLMNGEVKDEI